jgi:hypothetical protein
VQDDDAAIRARLVHHGQAAGLDMGAQRLRHGVAAQ